MLTIKLTLAQVRLPDPHRRRYPTPTWTLTPTTPLNPNHGPEAYHGPDHEVYHGPEAYHAQVRLRRLTAQNDELQANPNPSFDPAAETNPDTLSRSSCLSNLNAVSKSTFYVSIATSIKVS